MWRYADPTETVCGAGALGKLATALRGPSDRCITFDNKQYPAMPAVDIADRERAPALSIGSLTTHPDFHASVESYDLALPDRKGISMGESAK